VGEREEGRVDEREEGRVDERETKRELKQREVPSSLHPDLTPPHPRLSISPPP